MKFTLDIKTIITIAGVVAVLGGFYYSTQHRLSVLEIQVQEISEKLDVQAGQLKQIKRSIKRNSK
jgi:hypothetical protein